MKKEDILKKYEEWLQYCWTLPIFEKIGEIPYSRYAEEDFVEKAQEIIEKYDKDNLISDAIVLSQAIQDLMYDYLERAAAIGLMDIKYLKKNLVPIDVILWKTVDLCYFFYRLGREDADIERLNKLL